MKLLKGVQENKRSLRIQPRQEKWKNKYKYWKDFMSRIAQLLAPAEICKMDPFRRLGIKIVQTFKVSNINLAALPQKAFSPTQNHHCKLWLSTRGGSAINYVYIRMSRFIHGGFLKYGRNTYGGAVDKTTLSRLFIAVPTSCCSVTTTHVCNFSFSTNRTDINSKSFFSRAA